MTTIAASIHHRCMASDSQSGSEGTIDNYDTKKIFKLKDSRIVGVCGHLPIGLQFVKWLDGKIEKPVINKDELFTALVLDKKRKQVLLYSYTLEPMPYGRYAAIGSGSDHAITAMDCGKHPVDAVKYAIKRDPFSGGKIRKLCWD